MWFVLSITCSFRLWHLMTSHVFRVVVDIDVFRCWGGGGSERVKEREREWERERAGERQRWERERAGEGGGRAGKRRERA